MWCDIIKQEHESREKRQWNKRNVNYNIIFKTKFQKVRKISYVPSFTLEIFYVFTE